MEKIDLFDRYISNRLSEKDRFDFESRLKSDNDFASGFQVYLLTIDGVCREAHQDNLDFALAMKGLSKEQLTEIVGKHNLRHSDITVDESNRAAKPKYLRLKSWMWQISSIAAILIIAFSVVYNIEKNARYSVDDVIFAFAEINPDLVRSGEELIDVKSISDEELKSKLPELVNRYKTASNTDEAADNGFALAMAYLRLHDRDNAKGILEQLVSRFDGNDDYAESLNMWRSIINVLK